MRRLDVALVTCAQLPEPDPDESPILSALQDAGLAVEILPWDDAHVDWSRAKMSLLRSTWNYYQDLPRFLDWLDEVDRVSHLVNPASVVRWNCHKRYLEELALKGIKTVPTYWVDEGDLSQSLGEIVERHQWSTFVLKPAVSAASFRTYKMTGETLDEETYKFLVQSGDVMIQPYIASVEDYGERSMVCIEGEATHAVRKSPRFSDGSESVTPVQVIREDERKLALSAMACVGENLLYGRVDIVRDGENLPMVAELELIEPSLFFPYSKASLMCYVKGIQQRLSFL